MVVLEDVLAIDIEVGLISLLEGREQLLVEFGWALPSRRGGLSDSEALDEFLELVGNLLDLDV